MKRTIAYHMAAILGATMLASPALAQGGTDVPGTGIAPEAGYETGVSGGLDAGASGGLDAGEAGGLETQVGAQGQVEAGTDMQGSAGAASDLDEPGTAAGMDNEWDGEGTAQTDPAAPVPGMTDEMATGSAGMEPTQDDALRAVRANADNAASLGAMTNVERVDVIPVTQIGDYDDAAIEQALVETPGALEELQVSVESNPAIATQLQAQGVEPNSVIAAQPSAEGGLTVFVR